ncbi:MAG: Thoeris anti-defense Tad2 family protein [Sulfobacillus sp.]
MTTEDESNAVRDAHILVDLEAAAKKAIKACSVTSAEQAPNRASSVTVSGCVTEYMDYPEALKHAIQGLRCARSSWRGHPLFIIRMPERDMEVDPTSKLFLFSVGRGDSDVNFGKIRCTSYIGLCTELGVIAPYVASQDDQLAVDWVLV